MKVLLNSLQMMIQQSNKRHMRHNEVSIFSGSIILKIAIRKNEEVTNVKNVSTVLKNLNPSFVY